ncbi:MAG: hypothetical protein ACPHP8_06895 [Luminiphilus sp.]
MNPKRANEGKPCLRKVRHLWLGLMAIISAVLIQATAQAQTVKSADRISIDYGFVTQHYQTTWSDPTLPAGVARGMPPAALRSAMDNGSDNEDGSVLPADAAVDANSTGAGDDTSEAAVLYAIDLGEDGMTIVVSAKATLQPGDCAAIEGSGTYFNLRGVNAGFCDTTNQATIAGLRSVNVAAAQRCKEAREKLDVLTVEESQNLTPSKIGILCDGS